MPGHDRRLRITPRGRLLVQALLTVGVAIPLGVLLIESEGPSNPGSDWLSLTNKRALTAAPCPPQTSVHPDTVGEPDTVSSQDLAAARSGRFRVHGPGLTRLEVPVNWHQNPLGAGIYRHFLHKLQFLWPLLRAYAESGDLAALLQAKDLAIDWVHQNPRGGPDTAPDAWVDKTSGDRVPFLSYVIRAAACEGLLTPSEQHQFLASVRDHGRFLSDPDNYTPNNHGLFVDLGLLRITRFFPFLKQSPRWEAQARKRFPRTLRGRLADGIWLEHSSFYQLLVITSVEDFLAITGPDPTIERILASMRAAAPWFSRPDGRIIQFGDSSQRPAPDWTMPAVESQDGAEVFFDAGFYFVRTTDPHGVPAYLAVTNGFHNISHKHADDLSFELYDQGRPIVTDTGMYSKDPGPERDFALSARAHSTLTVEGATFPLSEEHAYGSGLVASGEGEGWFAVEGTNPLLRAQGVRHERLFLYKPGVALVLVDHARSSGVHEYARHLQLAPNIRISAAGPDTVALRGDGVEAWVTDAPIGSPAVRTTVRGQEEPPAGFTYPSFQERIPRSTVTYTSQGSSEVKGLAIALGSGPLRVTRARRDAAAWHVTVRSSDGESEKLAIERDGTTLTVGE